MEYKEHKDPIKAAKMKSEAEYLVRKMNSDPQRLRKYLDNHKSAIGPEMSWELTKRIMNLQGHF